MCRDGCDQQLGHPHKGRAIVHALIVIMMCVQSMYIVATCVQA